MTLLRSLSACLLSVLAFSALDFAAAPRDHTQFGRDITIAPGEEAQEVTCFGCNVRILGHVKSDVTVFGGRIVVDHEGEIGGDATAFGGDLRLGSGAKVGGDATVLGGRIQREASALIGGDMTSFGGTGWILLIFVLPLVFLGAFVALAVWLIRLLLRRRPMPVAI